MPFFASVERFGLGRGPTAAPKTSVTFTLPNLGGNNQVGIANDIFALKAITIKRFAVVIQNSGTATLSLYYKAGPISTNYNTSGWTLAQTVSGVSVTAGQLYTFSTVLTVDVPANSALSFFIYSSTNLAYSNGSAVGSSYASNSDLRVKLGKPGKMSTNSKEF